MLIVTCKPFILNVVMLNVIMLRVVAPEFDQKPLFEYLLLTTTWTIFIQMAP
jgi:hypothetical protein